MRDTFQTIEGERKVLFVPEERAPEFTDEALALEFAETHKDDLRYVAPWSRWLRYDGSIWRQDDTLHAFDLVRRVCREAAARCNKERTARDISSAKTVAAVERLAKSDRRLASTVDQWDSDPWLLNTPTGTIDLRSCAYRPHRAADYLTKITAASPGGSCPRFDEFLNQITGGDLNLQAYLQRAFGYAATGITKEHALIFLHGTGANGKSVLQNTIANVFGDYAKTAPIETFTASNFERHPTELAALRGARLVTATETEEGRQWAEARVKALTGGDKITARFMRQDFFEFVPTFKLMVAGNHLPGLKSVDEAIRRRFHLVPFAVTIPPDQRDPELPEKLKDEWPGILQWVIDGCLAWQAKGLSPPAAVTAATAAYLEAEDAMAAWLQEHCQTHPDAWESASALFADWKQWAEKAGEPARTQKRFSHELESRGFSPLRRHSGRGFSGLNLLPRMA